MNSVSRSFGPLVVGRAVAACVLAAATVVVAACGHAVRASAPAARQRIATPTALSPRHAIDLAVIAARRVNSLTMIQTVAVRERPGTPGIGIPGGMVGVTQVMSIELRPTFVAGATLTIGSGASAITFHVIVTARSFYARFPGSMVPTKPGRPWVRLDLARLPHGRSLARLLQELGGGQEETANPLTSARLFRTAKRLRVIGAQNIDGVPTMGYAGYLPPTAWRSLAPLAHRLASSLHAPVRAREAFKVWIDAEHRIRKVTLRVGLGPLAIITSTTITSINQPVVVAVPPASEISPIRQLTRR